jgi:hypothetical protein
MELHHFSVYDGENFFSLYGVHHGQPGEFAERGQDAMRGSKIIAGKREGLPALSGYTDTGMQVSGEKIMITISLKICLLRIVHKTKKVVEGKDIIGDRNIALLVPLIMKDIMIAPDEFDLDIGEVVPPFAEQLQFLVLAAMEEIAYYNELPWLKVLQLLDQALQVFFVNSLWNGDAIFPEMSCFTKMQIRQDQCFFFFPENTPVG